MHAGLKVADKTAQIKYTIYFCKILKHQISWESIYLFLSCYKRTDKQTDSYSNFDTHSLGMQTRFNKTVDDEVNVPLLIPLLVPNWYTILT